MFTGMYQDNIFQNMEMGKYATEESRAEGHPMHYKKLPDKNLQTEFWWNTTEKYFQEHHK